MNERFVELIKESARQVPLPVPHAPELPAHWKALAASAYGQKYRAVLFDVYGTLFSSAAGDISVSELPGGAAAEESAAAAALDAVAAIYGPGLSGAELRSFFSQKVKEIHSRLRQRTRWPEVQADLIWEEFLQERGFKGSGAELALRFELAVNPVYPMPGAAEAIAALHESGCLLGIISNAQFYTPLLFKAFFSGLPEEIGFDKELIIYSYMYSEAKPSPLLFGTAADRLRKRGIRAEECAFVGDDMLADIYGAQNAGFQGILFAGDSRSLRLRETDERLKGIYPSSIIRNLYNLI